MSKEVFEPIEGVLEKNSSWNRTSIEIDEVDSVKGTVTVFVARSSRHGWVDDDFSTVTLDVKGARQLIVDLIDAVVLAEVVGGRIAYNQ